LCSGTCFLSDFELVAGLAFGLLSTAGFLASGMTGCSILAGIGFACDLLESFDI
jgi:hypothetical protein